MRGASGSIASRGLVTAALSLHAAVAESWQGVYSVAPANPLPVTHPESEDPFVFRDTRGHFHLCVLWGAGGMALGQRLSPSAAAACSTVPLPLPA